MTFNDDESLGEEEPEPEVDLSAFLARQKLSSNERIIAEAAGKEEVDHTLAHLTSNLQPNRQPKKGQVQPITWDNELEEMRREKAIAEANWGTYVRHLYGLSTITVN